MGLVFAFFVDLTGGAVEVPFAIVNGVAIVPEVESNGVRGETTPS